MNVKKESILKIIFILWSVIVFFAVAWPVPVSVEQTVDYSDKLIHAILFGFFSYLLAINLKFSDRKRWVIIITSFFFSNFYAILGELVQFYVPGRTPSFFDFIAGLSGILISQIVFYVKE